jgi:hypothetical protein
VTVEVGIYATTLGQHDVDFVREAEKLGAGCVWSAEFWAGDAFTPLAYHQSAPIRPDDHDPEAPDRLRSYGRLRTGSSCGLVGPTGGVAVAAGEIRGASRSGRDRRLRADPLIKREITPDGRVASPQGIRPVLARRRGAFPQVSTAFGRSGLIIPGL